ncbi:MAG: TetR/AcrR family transcriptional regulator [Verrucomicrobiales bacterium]
MSNPPQPAPTETRDHILDVAERLFGEKGFDNVSLRAITAEAAVNLAAVNYHFGSKEGLIQEVIMRRLRPINAERLEQLDAAEKAAGKRGPDAGTVFDCFFRPVVSRINPDAAESEAFLKLMAHCMNANDRLSQFMAGQFREVVERFAAALGKQVPKAPPEIVRLRLLFSAGVLVYKMHHFPLLRLFGKAARFDEAADEMIKFAAAGFMAGVTDSTKKAKGKKAK